MTTEQAIPILHETIEFELRHPLYSQAVELAEFSEKIVSGKNQGDLVVQFKQREDKAQKRQRVHLTNTLTKYGASQIINFFEKVRRSDNRKKEITHPTEDVQAEITRMVGRFHGGKSLEDYLFNRLLYFTFRDPNAFIVFERRDRRGAMGEILETQVYPFEVPSANAIRYERDNGELQWLIVANPRTVTKINEVLPDRVEEIEVSDFFFYAPGFTVEMRETVADFPEVPEGSELVLLKKFGDAAQRKFIQTVYITGAKEVPAIQVGAYFSMETAGLFGTPLEPAHEIFRDLINVKSEFDLTRALHTFLQKIQYAPPCEFETPEGICQSGYINGDPAAVCPKCNGTGVEVHKTTQDVILIKWPGSKDEWIPLQDIVHYVNLPEWLPKWQSEQLEVILKRISLAVFGTEVFSAPTGGETRTATEIMVEWDKVYDRLTPYATKLSEIYQKGVRIAAQYIERDEGLTVEHKFPYDFKFETDAELLQMLKEAKEAGASYETVENIERKILEKQYANTPEVVHKILTKKRHKPFQGKSLEEIVFILSNRADDDPEKILYESFEAIFTAISEQTPDFFFFPYQRQKEVIAEKVAEVAQTIRYRTAQAPPMFED